MIDQAFAIGRLKHGYRVQRMEMPDIVVALIHLAGDLLIGVLMLVGSPVSSSPG